MALGHRQHPAATSRRAMQRSASIMSPPFRSEQATADGANQSSFGNRSSSRDERYLHRESDSRSARRRRSARSSVQRQIDAPERPADPPSPSAGKSGPSQATSGPQPGEHRRHDPPTELLDGEEGHASADQVQQPEHRLVQYTRAFGLMYWTSSVSVNSWTGR